MSISINIRNLFGVCISDETTNATYSPFQNNLLPSGDKTATGQTVTLTRGVTGTRADAFVKAIRWR